MAISAMIITSQAITNKHLRKTSNTRALLRKSATGQEKEVYGNLGKDYHTLGDYQQAVEYHKRALNIAKEVGDKAREGRAYGNLGKDYHRTGLLWDLSSPLDRPIRLTQCCTQFKPFGNKTFCFMNFHII